MKTKSIFFIMIAGAVFVACAKNKPADYYSDEQSEEIIETEQYKQQDNSSTKWKDFAGTTYKATQYAGNSVENNYSFSYSSSGTGKFILFGTELGTHVVTDQMEFNIYKVSSDAECIYLYCSEMDTPIKIRIKGHSLYTYDGTERYEEWR
jgi:uncharacterized protein YxeA